MDFALVGNIITNTVIPSSTILQIASVSLTSEKKKIRHRLYPGMELRVTRFLQLLVKVFQK